MGLRRSITARMSCNAAPLAEVMTPTRRASSGTDCFRSLSNRPSDLSLALSCSKRSCKAPSPAACMCWTMSWNSPRGVYRLIRPRTCTLSPRPGLNRTRPLAPRNMAQRIWASSSFSVKYQCPEPAAVKSPISPSTRTWSKWLSSRNFAWDETALTVRGAGISGVSLKVMLAVVIYRIRMQTL